jgi:hypothetical protein
VVSSEVQERVRESGAARHGALIGGPGSMVPAGSDFKLVLKPNQNIQTAQMKFEFLQTMDGSKDTFPHSKNLK